ncbi:hypothetical protein [Pseudonocardia asaccharolytica]|uniref:Uncharacterized protein n=1 Tax=Pseudonocardia asaccharolytica DSM 44247 = NBRC 16224 TaxID=1123024 RepID=A0A511D4T4_9PSEU|nr:hypothetical protein [Pseudonocardia asaccharolytica]GEL18614.1 hypothetical protein PA7_24510 [Pseudonocardia asaccharolytica DSM 44247 = NBRC 16224]
MSESNGKPVTIVPQHQEDDYESRYRPMASRKKVHEQIESSLREIVHSAAYEASQFVSLVYCDRKKDVAVRYGHLVDAIESFELAMIYLGMLKQVLSHRMRVEDEQNLGDPPF